MEKWHTRLLYRIAELGWSQAEFARRSSLPKERVYKYLQGKVKRPPDESDIANMAKAVGWTPAKLMYNTDLLEYAGGAETVTEEPLPMRRIPRYDWRDVGMLTAHTDGAKARTVKGKMPVPDDDDVSDEAFYTSAPDDANVPDIHKGDLLICDPKQKPIPGRYVIALVDGHGEPILAKYTVERYEKGVPVELALVFKDATHYGKHIVNVADVRILGLITHRTSKMA